MIETRPMTEPQTTDVVIARTFAKLHAVALGISSGILLGGGILAATVILLLKGGRDVGGNLSLLAQYFPGYSVTWPGSLIGAAYGLAVGFVLGWMLAFLRNFVIAVYLHCIKLWSNLSADRFLDGVDS
jgi:hypothetical protein